MVHITDINTNEDLYIYCCKKEHDINASVGVTPEDKRLLEIIKKIKTTLGENKRLTFKISELQKHRY